ncbi:MAG: peptide-methionine (S)-S-oxide reductase MsrA [Alphaproteobacteria bacterium]|nr:peptide-methionine (S)-S-oxide reductase MsrA [Alphaproteobacteria bacterium]
MSFCAVPRVAPEDFPELIDDLDPGAEGVAVLAGGCFWCVDAVYRQLDGVLQVTAGYAGGTPETADYRTVCSGTTGHAEVIMLRFDPSRITFGQILKVFFSVAHDPTQLNRQGNDSGRQYRSAIFYADDDQRGVAQAYIKQLDAAKVYDDKIVTSLEPLETFFEAEDYHQNYAALNPDQPYIAHISMPKVAKVRKHFSDRLKGS